MRIYSHFSEDCISLSVSTYRSPFHNGKNKQISDNYFLNDILVSIKFKVSMALRHYAGGRNHSCT